MKNSQNIVVINDYTYNKQEGKLRRLNKLTKKERNKDKVNSSEKRRKHILEELRKRDLEEEDDSY